MAKHKVKDLVEMPLFDHFLRKDRTDANYPQFQSGSTKPEFTGPDLEEQFDNERLVGLQRAVFVCMRDGKWRTFRQIRFEIGRGSENGIAAMLRGLRRKDRGSHTVKKKRLGDPTDGLWSYRLIFNSRSIRPLTIQDKVESNDEQTAVESDS